MEHHIADLQEQLQRELQHAKQEAREAVKAIIIIIMLQGSITDIKGNI
jgi:hypothetical protein